MPSTSRGDRYNGAARGPVLNTSNGWLDQSMNGRISSESLDPAEIPIDRSGDVFRSGQCGISSSRASGIRPSKTFHLWIANVGIVQRLTRPPLRIGKGTLECAAPSSRAIASIMALTASD
jgi:hypothetical protein